MEELSRKSVDEYKRTEKLPLILVMDNVRSMHNVGSVFRSADAFLIQAIYLCGYTPRPPHRDIHKTALGATETVSWLYFETTTAALLALKKEGYAIYAVEQVKDSIPLHRFEGQREKPMAFVFGNELTGVAEETLALCDGGVEIPQGGMKHSLNISVAVGIVLWELVRNR